MEAHNAYLQGHFYFVRRNLEDYRKAVGFFDEAIRLDPDYALAYAERSEAWTFIGDLTGERGGLGNCAERCREGGRDWPDVSPKRTPPWAGFAFCRVEICRRSCRTEARKELSPGNPTANDLLARVLVYLGHIQEAENWPGRRSNSTLFPSSRNNLARILYVEGKLDEAEASARKAAELQPTAASSHRWQVMIAILRGDGETALREAQMEPDSLYRRFELALAHYARGDRPAADAALTELIAQGSKCSGLSDRPGLRLARRDGEGFRVVTDRL